jgi:hypothetical protein
VEEEKNAVDDEEGSSKKTKYEHKRPGGNPVWGAYAYWISEDAYRSLMCSLRNDVGAMLWKGKRMRAYLVKPIDKILPRQIMSLKGESSVQLSTNPSFFRAPMLTSKIHTQWDPEFCKSTSYQLEKSGLDWSTLWLTSIEEEIVAHHSRTGEWLAVAELNRLQDIECQNEEQYVY